eukprot:1796911-Pyramimonas_sp.AAC.1
MSAAPRRERHCGLARGMGAPPHSCHAFCNTGHTMSMLVRKTWTVLFLCQAGLAHQDWVARSARWQSGSIHQ